MVPEYKLFPRLVMTIAVCAFPSFVQLIQTLSTPVVSFIVAPIVCATAIQDESGVKVTLEIIGA